MTRIISMLLACAIALTSLAACSSAPAVKPDSPSVTPAADEPGSEPANLPDEPEPNEPDAPAVTPEADTPEVTSANQSDEPNEPDAPDMPAVTDGPQVTPLSNMEELQLEQDIAMAIAESNGNEDLSPLGELSFKLYGQTEGAKGLKNNVFSPISAAIALGMLYEGTNGETAKELESVIGWDKIEATMRFATLMSEYADVNRLTDTTLNLANAAFFSPRLKNPADYAIMSLRDGYRAQMFRGELSTDSAREFINSWVSEKTEGEIPSLLGENLDASAVLVLINTVLLDAKWERPFENFGYTPTMQFTLESGEQTELPSLGDTRYMKYIDTDELLGAVMDYTDGRLKFMAVKPKDGDISGLMESLDYSKFAGALESVKEDQCVFVMPKFSIESEIDLNDCVKELGAKLIFDPGKADLTGFGESDNGNVFVSQILQKAKIDVDEEGTRAAAVTEIVACDSAAMIEYKEIILDSSFFWCVYDGETNIPLFMGTFTGEE